MMNKIKFKYDIPDGDRRHFVYEDDIRVLLSRLPTDFSKMLKGVYFKDRNYRGRSLGYVTEGRREIVIHALPPRVSLTAYLTRSQNPSMFGAIRGCQWPTLAIRRFMLYDVFLHELGHLQKIYHKSKSVRRKYAGETKAQDFGESWCQKLWSKPFDHPDPVHNPPSKEELEKVKKYWIKAHTEYKKGFRDEKKECYERAARHYLQAIEIFPEHSLALEKLGIFAYYGKGIEKSNDEAIKYLEKALILDPSLAWGNLTMAMALSQKKEHTRAESYYKHAINFYYHNPWVPITEYANALVQENRFEEAETQYKKAIKKNKNYPDVYIMYGNMLSRIDDPNQEKSCKKAIQLYQKAIELDPGDTVAYYNRGTVYHFLHKYNEAVQDFTKVIEINPNTESAYYKRALAYIGMSQQAEAASDFNQYLQIKKDKGELTDKIIQKVRDLGFTPTFT